MIIDSCNLKLILFVLIFFVKNHCFAHAQAVFICIGSRNICLVSFQGRQVTDFHIPAVILDSVDRNLLI